jgi:hypothetical protein
MGHRNIFEVTGLLPGYRAGALVNRDHDEQLTVFKSLVLVQKELMYFWVHALTCNAHRLVAIGCEQLSEDPVLAGLGAAASIALCIKHFVPAIKSIKGPLCNAIVIDCATRYLPT